MSAIIYNEPMAFIRNMFSKRRKAYGEQREDLSSADRKRRMSLAKDAATKKEILYYLAESDPDPGVRKAVIKNKSMPVHASPILAVDHDADVRLALAGRLVDLLPDISKDKHSQLYAYAVQALGTLALDEVLKIRTALSSTLKDHAHTPPKIAGQLARDVEREVSEPILRFCAALSDEDLLDILSTHPSSWVVQAIAGRNPVSEDVSEAVIEVKDVAGGTVLIENNMAKITEHVLQTIVEKARSFKEWQKPMAFRKSLPMSVAKQLAEFVDASVREILMQRDDFDPDETEEIAAVFRRRMDFAAEEEKQIEKGESIEDRLKRLISEGNLNEETISDALGMRDRDFVYAAMAYLGKTTIQQVQTIFEMQAPKPIVALSWHVGFSMRMAYKLQKDLGHVPPKELLNPKGGTEYPLSEDDLNWQLEFLGLKAS